MNTSTSDCNCSHVLNFHLIKFSPQGLSITHLLLDSLQSKVRCQWSYPPLLLMNPLWITFDHHVPLSPFPIPLFVPSVYHLNPNVLHPPSLFFPTTGRLSTASERATSTDWHKIASRNVPPWPPPGKGLVLPAYLKEQLFPSMAYAIQYISASEFRNLSALLEHT